VDLLGSRVMLFRDPEQAGRVVALDDFCPHR
jgi:phenylpropionate dioxygenase-like ring-hydroxylating dioxygenase large terminal subunit